jgi:hypothetical protein
MKKLLSLCSMLLFIAVAANAQTPGPAYVVGAVADNVHDRTGSEFVLHAMRISANVKPNPVVTRSVVDAGGAVIRAVVIKNEDGRVLRTHSNLNVLRFTVERPTLSPGLHLVDVVTDFGTATIKMMVQ